MLELLTCLLLMGHLLTMNLASAGPLVCVWLRGNIDEEVRFLGRRVAWWSVGAFLIGMFAGGSMLLTATGTGLNTALTRFPASAYWFAGTELVFSLGVMLVIAGAWEKLNRWGLVLLALINAANLLYHFPPMMAVIGQLASNPRWATEAIIDRPTLLKLMGRHEVVALSFHFGMSSLAVAGITLLHLISRQNGEPAGAIKSCARGGAVLALVATLAQIPIGLWLLMNLPIATQTALMGASLWASLTFMAALLLSIGLLHRLALVAMGETDRQNLRRAVSLLCAVVLLMTLSLRTSRPTPRLAGKTKTASSQQAEAVESFQIDHRDTITRRVLSSHLPANHREASLH